MKTFLLLALCSAAINICSFFHSNAQGVTPSATHHITPKVSTEELKKLRQEVADHPDNLKAHEAYLAAYTSGKDVKAEYDEWIKKYPKVSAIPYSIGKNLYDRESPSATPYLLKAAQQEPQNAKVWEMLWIDAQRWGQEDKAREYIAKAAAADPKNAMYAQYVAFSFQFIDTAAWRKKVWQMVDQYPHNSRVAAAISILGYTTGNMNEKIAIYEKLQTLFSPDTCQFSAVAMTRLCDAYIQTGQYSKAITLAGSLQDIEKYKSFKFSEMKSVATSLADIEADLKTGKYEAAKEKAIKFNTPGPRLNIGSKAIRIKAAALSASGDTKAAYDSLIVFQSKTPDNQAQLALDDYGKKLGKTGEQVNTELRTAVNQKAKPAPTFELITYGSHKKVDLNDLKGKIVFVTFWFPGCGPCRGEMPYIQNVINHYDKSKVVYLGINVFTDQDEYVLPFMKNTGYTFTALSDTEHAAAKAFGIRACPTNYIINQQGNIAYSKFMINADNEDSLDLMIKSLTGK